MIRDVYAVVEEDYNGVSPTFHSRYDTTSEFKDEIISFSDRLPSNARLLNIGGTPVECNYFQDRGFSVDNIDLSQAMLDEITKKSTKTKVIHQNITNFKTATPYNGIWACRSLIHIPPSDIDKTLWNIHLLLLSGGFIGAIFFKSESGDIEQQELPEKHANLQGLVYYRVLYSRKEIVNKFNQAGLKPIKIHENRDLDGESTIFVLAKTT